MNSGKDCKVCRFLKEVEKHYECHRGPRPWPWIYLLDKEEVNWCGEFRWKQSWWSRILDSIFNCKKG